MNPMGVPMGMKRPYNSMDAAGAHNNSKKQFNGMGGGFAAYGGMGFDMNTMAAMVGFPGRA